MYGLKSLNGFCQKYQFSCLFFLSADDIFRIPHLLLGLKSNNFVGLSSSYFGFPFLLMPKLLALHFVPHMF